MKIKEMMDKAREKHPPLDAVLVHVDSFYHLDFHSFNPGLLYIATCLREKGFNVKCLGLWDLCTLPPNELRRMFTISKPALTGFYTISDNIHQVKEMARRVKEWHPGTSIVVGGPLATSLGAKIMDWPHFDMSVIGEGEMPMEMLARLKVRGEGSIGEIPSLIYRQGNKVVANPPAPPIADLDSLPFPDPSLSGRNNFFQVVSGRGCPYNCLFCFQGVHGLKYRYRSAKNVTEEILQNLETYNGPGFEIIDDTFISNPARVKEISLFLQRYRERSGRDFIFFCEGRVDIIDRHPEMLDQLKAAGLAKFQVGFESGHPDVLKLYEKKIDHGQTRRVAQYLSRLGGVVMLGNFILGGPFEREETFRATLDFAKEILAEAPGFVEANAFFLGPYPGTRIAQNPEKYGLKTVDDHFMTGVSLSDVHMVSEAYDVSGMRGLRRRFFTEITAHMSRLARKIPRDMLRLHYVWADRYFMQSLWYQQVISRREALMGYFNFLEHFQFVEFHRVPPGELKSWHPQRVAPKRRYSPDGRQLILPETTGRYRLKDPEEILVYELSSGKLTVEAMAGEFAGRMGNGRTEGEIIEKVFIPVFKKLDSLYHMVFYH
jgi:radical SAM superfamily enzyme YgiQ (UPF0313 family)